jgi:hypothetical protein
MMISGRQKKYIALLYCWRLAIISLILPILIYPLLLFTPAGSAYGAPDTLDLQLDNPAIIRWDIVDIRPGDSGIEPVNLHNAGDISGYLYIWISDIADGEGLNPESETGNTAEPGELSSYLYLDIINPGMTFGQLTGSGGTQYINLPLRLVNFPTNSNQALFILDTALNPGETLELQWQWWLSPTAGNEAQGDTVSFTINYMLSSEHPGAVFIPGEPVNNPPAVPPTTPTTPPPTTEPSPTPTSTDIPDDVTDVVDSTDQTPPPSETITPAITDIEGPSANEGLLVKASLGIMISGTCAMTALATIERIRRRRRMKLNN